MPLPGTEKVFVRSQRPGHGPFGSVEVVERYCVAPPVGEALLGQTETETNADDAKGSTDVESTRVDIVVARYGDIVSNVSKPRIFRGKDINLHHQPNHLFRIHQLKMRPTMTH